MNFDCIFACARAKSLKEWDRLLKSAHQGYDQPGQGNEQQKDACFTAIWKRYFQFVPSTFYFSGFLGRHKFTVSISSEISNRIRLTGNSLKAWIPGSLAASRRAGAGRSLALDSVPYRCL